MATSRRKTAQNCELLATGEDDEEAEGLHRTKRLEQEEPQSSAEKLDRLSTAGCFESRSQEESPKTMVLPMVHLLVFASKHTSFHPQLQNSVMASIKSIRHSLSLYTVPFESFVFRGLLAALPALLCHSDNFIVVRSIALLGDMALHSYQSMRQIVNETQVLHNLLTHLNSNDAEAQKEACDTVASIASGAQGKRALCGLGAVQKLMHLLFVVTGFAMKSLDRGDVLRSSNANGGSNLSNHTQVILLSGVLEALDILTRDNFECLERVLQGSRVSVLGALQIMWKQFRNNSHPILQAHMCVLAKLIVWLKMKQENFDESLDDGFQNILEVLFGGIEAEVEHFWDEHWEHSPFLAHEGVIGGQVRSDLLEGWCAGADHFPLRKLLKSTSACPPFSCDELHTSQIFKEIEKDLGRPLVFGQDIRLVKSVCTVGCTESCTIHTVLEEDYQKIVLTEVENSQKQNCMFADIDTCVNAFELGHTIALRGLEFRCSHVAAIAEALAVCFGQATVGANLYMTPSNAQGFKTHYDDHCVLVWQITGCKAWKIWPPEVLVPRLYSQGTDLKRVCRDEEEDNKLSLKEGSVLYIPRGFPHAASTQAKAQKHNQLCCECPEDVQKERNFCSYGAGSCLQSDRPMSIANADSVGCLNRKKHTWGMLAASFVGNCHCIKKWNDSLQAIERNMGRSLHITFGVEVEPPFDWEGLIHMALQCWTIEQNWDDMFGRTELQGKEYQTSHRSIGLYTGLLHVAVRKCGDRCSAFRKACLIAAKPQQRETSSTEKFELIFKGLIQYVANAAEFKEALDTVLTAIDTPASTSLDWMHWLRHLSEGHEPVVWSDPVSFFHQRLVDGKSRNDYLEDMEVKFSQTKDSFVSCASYTQACNVFIALLHKYRNARRKYMEGMLALHV